MNFKLALLALILAQSEAYLFAAVEKSNMPTFLSTVDWTQVCLISPVIETAIMCGDTHGASFTVPLYDLSPSISAQPALGGFNVLTVQTSSPETVPSEVNGWSCTGSLYSLTQCSQACISGSLKLPCNGDITYCSNHTCAAVSSAVCTCSPVHIVTDYQINLDQTVTGYLTPSQAGWQTIQGQTVATMAYIFPATVNIPPYSVSNKAGFRRLLSDGHFFAEGKVNIKGYVNLGRKLLSASSTGMSFSNVRRQGQTGSLSQLAVQSFTSPPSNPCSFTQPQNNLIQISCSASVLVIVQKGTWQLMQQASSAPILVTVPQESLATSGLVTLTAYYNSQPVQSASLTVVGQVVCTSYDCVMCSEAISSFQCQSPAVRQGVIGLGVFLIVIVVIQSGYLIMLIWACCAVSYNLGYKCCCCDSHRERVKRWKKSMADNIEEARMKRIVVVKEEEPLLKQQYLQPDVARSPRPEAPLSSASFSSWRASQRRTGIELSALIILLMFPQALAQCSSGLFIPVNIKSCTDTGSSYTCALTFSLTTSVPTAGAQTCVTIADLEAGVVIGSVNIGFSSLALTLPLTLQYYTSDWECLGCSSNYCPHSGPCGGSQCQDTLPNDPNPYGALNGCNSLITTCPGVSSCRSDCGCAGCGCFYCESSCTWQRWVVHPLPNNGISAVYTPQNNGVFVPSITVNATVAGSSDMFSGPWPYSSTQTLGQFDVTTIGSFNSYSASWPSNVGILSTLSEGLQYTSIANVAPLNQPGTNVIGDIQANSPDDFSYNLSPNSFLFDPTMSVQNDGSQETSFSCPTPAFQQSSPIIGFLPPLGNGLYQGNYWTWQGGETGSPATLTTSVSNAGALVLTISTNTPVSFTQIKSVVCPSFEILQNSGCSLCDPGFVIQISAYSTCQSGMALVQSSDSSVVIYSGSIQLTTSKSTFYLNGATGKISNTWELLLSANGNVASQSVNFMAPNWNRVTNASWVTANNVAIKASDSSSWFTPLQDFFTNIFGASWWEIMLSVLLIIVAGVLAVVFVFKLPAIIACTYSRMNCCKKKQSMPKSS